MTKLVFIDADNTLWDTNAVYKDAQLWLLGAVEAAVGVTAPTDERLAYVREVDQAIAAQHHGGLRYPTQILARAIALVLSGEPVNRAVKRVWTDKDAGLSAEGAMALEDAFKQQLDAKPALRPGVAQGLERLRTSGFRIFILTEGQRDRIERTLAAHGLDRFGANILEAKKEPGLFKRVSRLEGADSACMIGDQLDRDIAPAKAAGLTTIYFPGGFSPKWTPQEREVAPDYKVASLDEAADMILTKVPLSRVATAS